MHRLLYSFSLSEAVLIDRTSGLAGSRQNCNQLNKRLHSEQKRICHRVTLTDRSLSSALRAIYTKLVRLLLMPLGDYADVSPVCQLAEYAMKAATSGGNTAIAVRSAKSAAFITQKKVPVSLMAGNLSPFCRS
jgi:hypothetical protein